MVTEKEPPSSIGCGHWPNSDCFSTTNDRYNIQASPQNSISCVDFLSNEAKSSKKSIIDLVVGEASASVATVKSKVKNCSLTPYLSPR